MMMHCLKSRSLAACCMVDDFLNIGGTNYDGANCPQGVALSGGTTIRWISDGSVAGDGWEICTGAVPPPPPEPNSCANFGGTYNDLPHWSGGVLTQTGCRFSWRAPWGVNTGYMSGSRLMWDASSVGRATFFSGTLSATGTIEYDDGNTWERADLPVPPPPPPPQFEANYDEARGALATAPLSVTVSGLECNTLANAVYELQEMALNGRPHYMTPGGRWHLYWTPNCDGSAAWVINPDTADPTCGYQAASLFSAATAPPGAVIWPQRQASWGPRSAVYNEWCGGESFRSRLTLTVSQADTGWCARAWQDLLPHLQATCCSPDEGERCANSHVIPSSCGIDCARLWAPFAEQCRTDEIFYGQPEISAFFVGEVRVKYHLSLSSSISLPPCVP
jgi:hypothetical protein